MVYNRRGFDTDVDEEPLLSWIVTSTQQTATGGEYEVLLDYEDNMLIIMVDHKFGSRMIDVGQTTNTGDRLFEMIQRLLSIPHNMTQPLDMHAVMVEVCEIFQMDSNGQQLLGWSTLLKLYQPD